MRWQSGKAALLHQVGQPAAGNSTGQPGDELRDVYWLTLRNLDIAGLSVGELDSSGQAEQQK